QSESEQRQAQRLGHVRHGVGQRDQLPRRPLPKGMKGPGLDLAHLCQIESRTRSKARRRRSVRMERLVYTGPEACETLFDPTVEQLIAILRRGPEYWGHDSGDASLQWCFDERATGQGYRLLSQKEKPKLSILHNEPNGFHFAYSGPDQPFLVPFDASAPDQR